MRPFTRRYVVDGDDFARAGEASSRIKQLLKDLGFVPEIVRRAAIAVYEAEINMVIHAYGGSITVNITPDMLEISCADQGPGIPDVELAMQEGWSTASPEVRGLGFGAGMGLPNICKYSDEFLIETEVGIGTVLTVRIYT